MQQEVLLQLLQTTNQHIPNKKYSETRIDAGTQILYPRINCINPRFFYLYQNKLYTSTLYRNEERQNKTSGKEETEDMAMKYLIVGLGNIGPEYHETRHNIGFMVVDALAKAEGITFRDNRYGFTSSFSLKGNQLLLLKPSTYMNLSGNAVRYWMQKENIPLENTLVIVDDLALPFGTLRLKGKGSDAGHNGLKHIAATLGTQNYARLRFGIGNDFPRGGQIDYVLGHFTEEDQKNMKERLETAGEIIKSFCLAGINITMNQYNKK